LIEQSTLENEILNTVRQAKEAATTLAGCSADQRQQALAKAAAFIHEQTDTILSANQDDLSKAEALARAGELSPASVSRLRLDARRIAAIANGITQVASLPDPLSQTTLATELDTGLNLYRVTCPIGLIAVIFESRPDALPQIASLCIKTGNAVILKGGAEALSTNRILFDCMERAATAAGLPAKILTLLESREAIQVLLTADRFVDLVIPRGSNQLVRHIQSHTRIPVLGHADGLCHLYIDQHADLAKAVKIAVDSKVQYPAACNAVETLLVHKQAAEPFLRASVPALEAQGVELRMHDNVVQYLSPADRDNYLRATEQDWSTEYCELILSIKVVESLDEAIAHINQFGSHHTDAIVTEDESTWRKFFAEVDSAGVYRNASTRFADGYRYGFGAEVGISTTKLHPRGPVGMEGLITYKYRLEGAGHIVADYSGENAKPFKHRPLDRPGQ
jgi:glutamate-5-semialdehyde dehydrogenase